MPENVRGNLLDIFWSDKGAARQESVSFATNFQSQRGAGRGAKGQQALDWDLKLSRRSGGLHKIENVVDHLIIDVDGIDQGACLQDLIPCNRRLGFWPF